MTELYALNERMCKIYSLDLGEPMTLIEYGRELVSRLPKRQLRKVSYGLLPRNLLLNKQP